MKLSEEPDLDKASMWKALNTIVGGSISEAERIGNVISEQMSDDEERNQVEKVHSCSCDNTVRLNYFSQCPD